MPGRPPTCRLRICSQLSPDSISRGPRFRYREREGPSGQRRPRPQDIRREIRHSVSKVLLFSVYCLIVYHTARNGATTLYFDFGEHPWWWGGRRYLLANARASWLTAS